MAGIDRTSLAATGSTWNGSVPEVVVWGWSVLGSCSDHPRADIVGGHEILLAGGEGKLAVAMCAWHP